MEVISFAFEEPVPTAIVHGAVERLSVLLSVFRYNEGRAPELQGQRPARS